jgi:asparagine synthase (glutamine-hydrolysing)
VPLPAWFRSDDGLGALVQQLPDAGGADVFDRSVLRRLVGEHRSGGRDHSELLWTALNVATWRETFHV